MWGLFLSRQMLSNPCCYARHARCRTLYYYMSRQTVYMCAVGPVIYLYCARVAFVMIVGLQLRSRHFARKLRMEVLATFLPATSLA